MDENGVLFNKDKNLLVCYPEGKMETTYEIPIEVTNIGENAFHYLRRLTEITIPIGVTNIGYTAFQSCSGLTSITLPEGLITIEAYAFSGCTNLISIILPNSLINLQHFAFNSCSNLTNITLMAGLTNIGSQVFNNCISLTNINVVAENLNYSDLNGVLFNKLKTELIIYPEGKTDTTYIVPIEVNKIRNGFRGCSSLTSIIIGDNITNNNILNSAFWDTNNELKIYCIEGSGIETFAMNNNINYENLIFDSLTIDQAPTKTSYIEGESFNPSGMKINRVYTYDTDKEVEYKVENNNCIITPLNELTTEIDEITISYTENGVTRTTTQAITIIYISSEIYNIDIELMDITNIGTETTQEVFLDNIICNYPIVIQNSEDEAIGQEEKIKTGMKIVIVVGEEEIRLVLVVKGDTNGDGLANARDALANLYHRAYLNDANNTQYVLTDIYFKAGDLDQNGIINGQDALRLLYHRARISGYEL